MFWLSRAKLNVTLLFMKTKRKKSEVLFEVQPESTVEDIPVSSSPSTFSRPKIAVPIKEDGTFDLDAMREATKEKLRAAIAGTPGINPPQATTPGQMFPPQVVWAMYGALGAIESMVAQRMGKVPKEIADRVFTYSPQELELLTPPTSRVLQKYAGEWLIKYQDEIALATLLTSITIAKVNASIMLSKQHSNVVEMPKKEEETPPEPVKPN
jgi:hypothetical protein